MKELGYGKDYKYAHEFEDAMTDMKCLPDALEGRVYYSPTEYGQEQRVKERMEQIEEWRRKARG